MTDRLEDNLLTVQECAALGGITDEAIYLAIRQGRLSCVERYGRKLVERQAWERYRAEKKTGRPRKED